MSRVDQLATSVEELSLELGGDGDVSLHFTTSPSDRRRPWQAATTVKHRRRPHRRLWVWGYDPEDALLRLLNAMPDPASAP